MLYRPKILFLVPYFFIKFNPYLPFEFLNFYFLLHILAYIYTYIFNHFQKNILFSDIKAHSSEIQNQVEQAKCIIKSTTTTKSYIQMYQF